MRRAFVADDGAACGLGFAFALALHQHVNPAGQGGDLAFLAGDDIRQIVDGADQVGDLFFELFHAGSPLVPMWAILRLLAMGREVLAPIWPIS